MYSTVVKIVSVLILLTSCICPAINKSIVFERLTIEDGLSQSSVRAIYQDKTGFMWFGTEDGLNRFDGHNFKIFRNDPHDSSTISSNYILDIVEDADGHLWIATFDGLNVYYEKTQTFATIKLPDSAGSKGITDNIQSVLGYNDPGDKVIWYGIREGVFKYDIETGENYLYGITSDATTPKKDNKNILFRDSKNNIWVMSNVNGIYEYLPEQDEFERINMPGLITNRDGQYTELFEDSDGCFWFGSIDGLNSYDPTTGKFRLIRNKFEKKLNVKFNSNFVNCIEEESDGNLFLATSGYGLVIYNKIDERISVYKYDPYDTRTISADVSHTVYRDNDGLFWFGTHGKGIYIYNPYLNRFNLHRKSENGLSIGSVRTFCEDKDGFLWISGYTGIDRYNPAEGTYTSYYKNTSLRSTEFLDETAYCIINDKQNPDIMYFGTEGSGLFSYSLNSKRFKSIFPRRPGDNSSGDYLITFLYDDGNGNLWIGTGNELIGYRKSTGRIMDLSDFNGNPFTTEPQFVTAIHEGGNNSLLIGTYQSGLFKLDLLNKKFIGFDDLIRNCESSIDENTKQKLNACRSIKCIQKDSAGNLWIGTTTGLVKLDTSRSSVSVYTVEDGLPNNVIYGILEDPDGYLWLSTNLGLCKFNPLDGTTTLYDVRDGLQSNEFNTNAYLKTSDGMFLFGGINGYNAFYPEAIRKNRSIPRLTFTDFRLSNKSVGIGEVINGLNVLKSSIFTTRIIQLKYDENVFTFEFTALDYSSSGKNLYSYKLTGFDNEWSSPARNRSVTYTNLDPGKYVLNVIGANADGIWNRNGISMSIIIRPPFWMTWWFITIVLLIISAILYAFYRSRVSKILELERLRVSIASDLHDDIGATLSKLALRADLLKQSIQGENFKRSLDRIAETSRLAVGTMQDIVWSIDSRNDTFESMLNKMKDFTFSILADKEIKVNFVVEGFEQDGKLPIAFRQNIYLILKEAVNNIVKHSNAEEVEIRLAMRSGKFRMQLKDNGTNFCEKEFNVGHGLKNMKMRAAKIGAELDYRNENGFEIRLTCRI